MLKEQAKLFSRMTMGLDLLLLFIAFLFSYFLTFSSAAPYKIISHAWVLIIVFPLWLFFSYRNQLYASIRQLDFIDIFLNLLKVQISSSFVLGFLIWLIDKNHFSRSMFVWFVSISFLLLLLEKLLLRCFLGFLRKKNYNVRYLLIVGTREKAQIFHELLEQHNDWGLHVIGFLQAIEDEPLLDEVRGYKVLGYARDLVEVCKNHPIDEVVFCLPGNLVVDAESYLHDLEELGITIRMVVDYFDIRCTRKTLDLFHNKLPILTFHSKCLDAQQLLLKRLLDITGALVGLGILALALPFIAFAIKRNSPGPLFFGQERVGESGRRFICWKFRSMYIDAEERKAELMASNEMNGAIFKMKNDPRVTSVGRILRKTSLDELPQFWNVLLGNMSLVGTRPPTPAEVDEYENWHRRRITIKPGITGLWQVSGRNNIDDFDEIVRLDIAYIDKWSVWLDIKLLLQTLKVVFAREGSC